MRWMKRRQQTWAHVLVGVLVVVAVTTVSALAQAPILEFSFDDQPIEITSRGSASAWLRLNNFSVYAADDIEIVLLSGPVGLPPIEPIKVLAAFSDTLLEVPMLLGTVPIGEAEAAFELAYTYCVGDLCFQIVEQVTLRIEVIPAPVVPVDAPINGVIDEPVNGVINEVVPEPAPTHAPQRTNPWKLAFPIALGLLLVGTLIASRLIKRQWWLFVLLLAVVAGGLSRGIMLRQDEQAQSIGAVLCMSCVGLEQTPPRDPELSPETRTRLETITHQIELLFFTAEWCRSCPYAKSMVQQVAQINPLISYRVIDVDQDRDAAHHYGIVTSGRTIVPAILRLDTREVLFGIEDLERRLLDLLKGET